MTVEIGAVAREILGERMEEYSTREEWLEARRTGYRIGASDVAKVLGVSPYGSEWDVWAKKKLNVSKEYSAQQLANFERGHRWEGRIVEDYAIETGLDVWHTDDMIIRHEEHEWISCSPDGLVLDGGELGGVEVKTDRDSRLWGESGQVIESWADGAEAIIRPDYALQVYWTLLTTGRPWWDMAVALPQSFDFPELRHYRVMRDEAIQARILAKVSAWRDQYLIGDDEPDPDGSEAARLSLLSRFPGRGDKVVRDADDGERSLLLDLAEVKAELADLERTKKTITQKVCAAIGDDYGITLGKAKALWTPTKGRAGLDTKALKADHPEIAAQYATQGKPYRSLRLYGFDK